MVGALQQLSLDSLPDDCLGVILQLLHESCKPALAPSNGAASLQPTGGGVSSLGVSGGGSIGGVGGAVSGAVNGPAIVAAVAASILASPTAEGSWQQQQQPSGGGPHGHGGVLAARRAQQGARQHPPAMPCVCSRFRNVCRQRAIAAWLAAEGVNAAVACYHPHGQQTTLLHAAAAEGMQEACELLLLRGACPLSLDSCGRSPLQVARGSAALLAKLITAQERSHAASAQATEAGGAKEDRSSALG